MHRPFLYVHPLVQFPNAPLYRAISIIAPRLWNDLTPELRTFFLPPPSPFPITNHHLHPASLFNTPGLPTQKLYCHLFKSSYPDSSDHSSFHSYYKWHPPSQLLCLLWPFGNRTWTYHRLPFGQPLLFVAALVNKLVPCAWLWVALYKFWDYDYATYRPMKVSYISRGYINTRRDTIWLYTGLE